MGFSIKKLIGFTFILFFFTACDSDDDSGAPGQQEEEQSTVSFTLNGGIDGAFSGRSSLGINVFPQGSAVNWQFNDPEGSNPVWKLEFAYNDQDTLIIGPGTYSLGSGIDVIAGEADLMALYVDESVTYDNGLPANWGGAQGDVEGSVTVTSQVGDFLEGTFELTLSDGGSSDTPFEDLIITEGAFRTKMTVAYIE